MHNACIALQEVNISEFAMLPLYQYCNLSHKTLYMYTVHIRLMVFACLNAVRKQNYRNVPIPRDF